MSKEVSPQKVEAAVEELNNVRKQWLRRPGVTAVDVGFKIKEKKLTAQLSIRVHVKRKLHDSVVERDAETFTTSAEPKKLGAFPIDVIEAEYTPAQIALEEIEAVDRKARTDPLVGGISVGNPRITAGTLGAIVWDRSDCKVCMVSNWHVLCGSQSCTVGESIYQPGKFDGGTAADTAATLKRFRLDNHNDSALAGLNGSRGYSRDIVELSPIPGVIAPSLGMHVRKSGRTTGLTEGIIDGVSLSTSINYDGVVNAFQDQIHIVPRPPWPSVDYEVSKGGDSGSVWVDDATGNAVGLHFAGETSSSPSAEHAVANQMVHVAADLNFSFKLLFCPVKPKFDRDWLRRIILAALCRRYPWICRQHIPTPRPFPWPDPGPYRRQSAGCDCGGSVENAEAWESQYGDASVEDVVDEIIAQLEASR
jgi:endonuclease G